MRVGVTDTMGREDKFLAYCDWLKAGYPAVDLIRLSYADDNLSALSDCDGVVLTGGGDVDPRLYGGDPIHPKVSGVDTKRDDFERKVIDSTIRAEKPLLGVCRGLQLTNVHLGGTLVPDLVEAGKFGHASTPDQETFHGIVVDSSTKTGLSDAVVRSINSYHHQAAGEPGPGLHVTGRSDDGVIEMLEPADGMFHSFLLLVQWHPERMQDTLNPFCYTVRMEFYQAIQQRLESL